MPLQLLVLTVAGQSLRRSAGIQTLPAEPASIMHFTAAKGMGVSGWCVLRLPCQSCVSPPGRGPGSWLCVAA